MQIPADVEYLLARDLLGDYVRNVHTGGRHIEYLAEYWSRGTLDCQLELFGEICDQRVDFGRVFGKKETIVHIGQNEYAILDV